MNIMSVCCEVLELAGWPKKDVILYLKLKVHKNERTDPASELEHCSSENDSDAFKEENSEQLYGKE